MSAAYSRTFQYTQALAPAGPGVGPDLHVSDVWLMAHDTVPALRSDLATVGAEVWWGAGWLGSATLYGRYTTGLTVPDPAPGVLSPTRPVFVAGQNQAGGLELSVRRLAGRVTGSLAYSEGVSEVWAAGWRYPSGAERRRAIDATAMVRLSPAVRAGAAFSAASGAPYTRFVLGPAPCDTLLVLCTDSLLVTNAVERPNAHRAPTYVTMDLLAEWSRSFSSWRLAAFVQLRNALNRRNAVTYVGSFESCTVDPRRAPDRRQVAPGVCDAFDRGLPLLPLVGVSVAF